MPIKRPVDMSVRWDLSRHPDGTATLTLTGELDPVSTPQAWASLETEFAGSSVVRLEVDVRQLVCDGAAWMRASGAFGRVVEPGSGLTPTLVAEVSVNELYGDFRQASRPVGRMAIHFICYEVKDGDPGRIVLDRVCAHETPLARKAPAALMSAWDADLREIMEEIHSAYSKAKSKER